MTIKPKNYAHVWQRFLELGTEREENLKMLRQELAAHENEMQKQTRINRDSTRDLETRMAAYEEIKAERKKRNLCFERLETQLATPAPTMDEASVKEREIEFARICALPQLKSAFVDSNNAIHLIVSATYNYEGVIYYLGDWAIVFGHSNPFETPTVTNYMRLLKPAFSPGDYPDYGMADNSFCLGDNRKGVASHFKYGRYFQAIQLIVYAVNSVNKGDIEMIPDAFYPVLQASVLKGIVQWPLSIIG